MPFKTILIGLYSLLIFPDYKPNLIEQRSFISDLNLWHFVGGNGDEASQSITSCFGAAGGGAELSDVDARMVPTSADLCRSSAAAAVSGFSLSGSSHLHRPSPTVFSSWWTFWCWCFSPSWASSSSPTSFTCCDYAACRGGGRRALRTMLDLLPSITGFRHEQW